MDYLSDSDSAKAPDTSITSVIGLFGEKLILRNQVIDKLYLFSQVHV